MPDELYVGYLPAPAGAARFARLAAAVLVVCFAMGAGLLAAFQDDPGAGSWEANPSEMYSGVLLLDPYPRIVFDKPTKAAGPINPADSAILVEEGKFGADGRSARFKEQPVRVQGTLIEREGRAVLELSPALDAIEAAKSDVLPDKPFAAGGASSTVQLEGEIVDPKCYLGVMRPGRGKTHLSCAELCISGGIPPVLVVRRAGGADAYLLVTSEGSPANSLVRGHVGGPVRVAGTVEGRRGGWEVLRVTSIADR